MMMFLIFLTIYETKRLGFRMITVDFRELLNELEIVDCSSSCFVQNLEEILEFFIVKLNLKSFHLVHELC